VNSPKPKDHCPTNPNEITTSRTPPPPPTVEVIASRLGQLIGGTIYQELHATQKTKSDSPADST
jgi:hypothetical protein